MDIWQAILLGLVEGITEYLPVSSTGHLLVAQRLLGIPSSEASNAFAIAIQAGAILAVILLYRHRFTQVARGIVGKDPVGARLGLLVLVAFLPAAVAGKTLDKPIERVLFGPWPIVVAWVVGGVVILLLPKALEKRAGFGIDALTLRQSLTVGAFQCLALWPGTSRSLAAILGGLVVGLSLSAAVEFSFLLGFITLGAATAYKALQHGPAMLAAYGVLPVVAGLVVSWLSAMVAVRWMVRWLEQRGLRLFGWWRLAVAAIVVVLLLGGGL